MPELIHTFRLPVPVDRAWAALDDPDLVASAFPGAEVTDRGSDSVSGELSVKVGPVRARYAGDVQVTWRDRPARRFVLEVAGDEVDGLGTLQATIHVTLDEADDGAATTVELRTNLAVTGRVAQFGDAVLEDVLGRHLQGLAAGLEAAGFPEAAPRPDLPERGRPVIGPFEEPGPAPEPEPEPAWSTEHLPSAARDLEEADPIELHELPPEDLRPEPPSSSLPPPPPPPVTASAQPEPEAEPDADAAPEPPLVIPLPPPPPPPPPKASPPPPPAPPTAPAAPPAAAPPVAAPPEVLSWTPPAREDDQPPPAPPEPVLRPERRVARVVTRKTAQPTPPRAPAGPTHPIPAVVPPPPTPAPTPPPASTPPPSPTPTSTPPPAPTSTPAARPEPVRAARPERSPEAAADDASLAAKAAPYAIVLLLLWILRRMFGSDDR